MFINGSFSFPHLVKCGVPQGSCLDPLLYLIYTNYFSHILSKSNTIVFADVTTVYTAGHSAAQIEEALQMDLLNINRWICSNKHVLKIK